MGGGGRVKSRVKRDTAEGKIMGEARRKKKGEDRLKVIKGQQEHTGWKGERIGRRIQRVVKPNTKRIKREK